MQLLIMIMIMIMIISTRVFLNNLLQPITLRNYALWSV
jgi:hypothetical protein